MVAEVVEVTEDLHVDEVLSVHHGLPQGGASSVGANGSGANGGFGEKCHRRQSDSRKVSPTTARFLALRT